MDEADILGMENTCAVTGVFVLISAAVLVCSHKQAIELRFLPTGAFVAAVPVYSLSGVSAQDTRLSLSVRWLVLAATTHGLVETMQ